MQPQSGSTMPEEDNMAMVSLRDYVEAIFEEQRRGMLVAEEEREKAAKALRDELARAIEEGDRALRDHITQQIAQIREALNAARREADIRFEAAQAAIAKAEAAYEKRFESMNEWRGQSADRERTQQEDRLALEGKFAGREVMDAQLDAIRREVQDLREKMGKLL